MIPEVVLKAALADPAGTVAVMVADRIYPDLVPADIVLPAIAYARVETEYHDTLLSGDTMKRALIDIWCMGASRSAANDLGDAAEITLESYAVQPGLFELVSRRSEYDADTDICATVLTVGMWFT